MAAFIIGIGWAPATLAAGDSGPLILKLPPPPVAKSARRPAASKAEKAKASQQKNPQTAPAQPKIQAATPLPATASELGAVIFLYHRFGEDRLPETNTAMDVFEAHLDRLAASGRTVRPLSEVASALAAGKAPAADSVAITIDDAYLSAATAWPRLKARGWTATLFVATEPVEQGLKGYMSWEQIKRLKTEGLEIGAHGHAHIPYGRADDAAVKADLAASRALFMRHLGALPTLFALPYGSWRDGIEPMLRAEGYLLGFAQHSGVAAVQEGFFQPRFAVTGSFAAPAKFAERLAAVPLPLNTAPPLPPVLTGGSVGFTLSHRLPPDAAARLTCFLDGTALPATAGADGLVITPQPAKAGYRRVNCTAPAGGGRWHWWGRQVDMR